MTGTCRADSTAVGCGVFYQADYFRFGFGLAETLWLEAERLGPVAERVIGIEGRHDFPLGLYRNVSTILRQRTGLPLTWEFAWPLPNMRLSHPADQSVRQVRSMELHRAAISSYFAGCFSTNSIFVAILDPRSSR
jgi:hypothetical protein